MEGEIDESDIVAWCVVEIHTDVGARELAGGEGNRGGLYLFSVCEGEMYVALHRNRLVCHVGLSPSLGVSTSGLFVRIGRAEKRSTRSQAKQERIRAFFLLSPLSFLSFFCHNPVRVPA